MCDISLVIINDDAEDYLNNLFISIQEQISLNDLDIIFIDNCSSDNSVQKAQSLGINKIYSSDKKTQNRGVLYNKGLELANRRYVIFGHSDIYFAKDFFQKLMQSFNEESQYGFINFLQYYVDRNYFGNNQIGLDYSNQEVYYKQIFQSLPDGTQPFLECSEGCFMIDRQCVNYLGFNQIYKDSFFDYELLGRILESGGKSTTTPNCIFYHYFLEFHEKIINNDFDKRMFTKNLLDKHFREHHIVDEIKQKEEIIAALNAKVIKQAALAESLDNELHKKNTQIEVSLEQEKLLQSILDSRSWKLLERVKGIRGIFRPQKNE